MNDKLLSLLMIPLLAALPLAGSALPEDNQQPINVKANRATQQNLDSGEKTEYFGDVVMTQGSLLLNADHLVIHSVDRKVTQVIATGTPARLQQQSDPDNPPVTARADTIDYQLTTEMITLTDNASLDQPDASFSGNHLTYNVATEEVIAEDGVNMIFIPASGPKTETTDDTSPTGDNSTQTQGTNGDTTGP